MANFIKLLQLVATLLDSFFDSLLGLGGKLGDLFGDNKEDDNGEAAV